ncbi:MAG: sensor domain-containing diguanylate cyclase [Proteobacteria bacterium]|nr:sensor domain-containing diguanylate cyclase [Pseudomonadota bacterium]
MHTPDDKKNLPDRLTDEAGRLHELHAYRILDTPPDGAFDDITRLAAKYFGVPIAIVSLVDKDRVWFKSAYGLDDVDEIARGPGLCASAIMQDDCYIAEELRRDPNALANPLVAKDNGLRFYAATPLRSRNGFNLGTFCILDLVPRTFSAENSRDLEAFGKLVMNQMEQRLSNRKIASIAQSISKQNQSLSHAASHDPLTGLLNRAATMRVIEDLSRSQTDQHGAAVLILDVDRFKAINDTHGHPVGDAVLVDIAHRIRSTVRADDHVARYGGEEFLIILRNCPPEVAQAIAGRIRAKIAQTPVRVGALSLDITISGGLCHSPSGGKLDDMIKAADASLYAAKNAGRNRIVVSTCQAA